MLAAISTSLLAKLAGVPLQSKVAFLEALFNDRRALEYAKEALRDKYEQALLPTQYDYVIDNFRIAKQDFIDYLRSTGTPSSAGIRRHLRGRLESRTSVWTHNPPTEALHSKMVTDFYDTYLGYFLTTDPQLATLHLTGLVNDTAALLSQLRAFVKRSQRSRRPVSRPLSGLLQHVRLTLTVAGVPYNIIEESDHHVDLAFTDPSSILPSSAYLTVYISQPPSTRDIDHVNDRAHASGSYSHLFIITDEPHSEIVTYAQRRRIQICSPKAFHDLFSHITTSQPYLIGALAAERLAKTLHIDQVYISPDVVTLTGGGELESRFYAERSPSDTIVESFLASEHTGVLFILGNYGAGKSAVAAHIFRRFSGSNTDCAAAYLSLRDVREPSNLPEIVTRCSNTLRLLFAPCSKTLVICDGLDELCNAMSPNERKANTLAILRAAHGTDKLSV